MIDFSNQFDYTIISLKKGGVTVAVSDKIKALLKLQGKKTEDLAEALGLASKQALYNKFNRDSFTAADLIKAADFLECDLNFETKEGQKITLTANDLEK